MFFIILKKLYILFIQLLSLKKLLIFNDYKAFRKNSDANQIISYKQQEILDLHVVLLVQILYHLVALERASLLFLMYLC